MFLKQGAYSASRRSFLKTSGALITASAAPGLFAPALAQGAEVKIISNLGNADQRAVLDRLAKEFTEKTGTPITINNMDHEAHKTQIRSYLVVGAPDICFWFSGNRMKAFVEKGLFDDISDLFADQNLMPALGATAGAVTVDGKQYGLPTAGLLWGLFYRKDVFEANGWTAPATWDDFLNFGEAAKGKGMTPLSFGSKELWPAGGFFDHLSLRVNGLE
jgi:multiple sugar transport system substrate-binding protein